ncbi:hypothetical protein H5410_006009 [Solanum commersonii]|uniref:Uncharacterized protein n=1 Tax=Solanum commersonii TaxID=4109 RepID=A0A9J6A9Z7_SOLCO|nr:hypothetical protein H5410_006009 [Solanum commersonii]
MDNALPLLTSSKIKKFTLHFIAQRALSNYSSKPDKCLQIALNKKVEDFDLKVWHSYDFFGFYLDSDRIPEDRIFNWTSLKSLTLSSMLLCEEHIEQISSNCHQLESFKLCEFYGFHHLHLTFQKCTRLELIDHNHPPDYMGGECYFEIVAPYVQHLKISGKFYGVEIRLGDLSSLIHADLTYDLYHFHGSDELIDKSIVKDHLTSIISMLMLHKEDVSLPLLLNSIPCLEKLTIFPIEDCLFIYYWCKDMDVLEDKYENIFLGSLQNLTTLKVILPFSIFIKNDSTEIMI